MSDWLRICSLTLALACLGADAPRTSGGGKRSMPSYEGKYYVIHSDLAAPIVREADLRMTKMAEEYHERTKDFSGAIQQKLPFYLFADEKDYLDFGGVPGSAGIFDVSSQVLMALAGEKPSVETWHVLQHEGFHQFAAAVIGGELPIWVNEGLAEYFGEGIFTGDGFVTGIIPDWRLRRVKQGIRAGKFRPVREIMQLSHEEWNEGLSVMNYDQAWTMVHFLAQAENGKYQKAFVAFMQDLGARQPWEKAWENSFGSIGGFEEKWRGYWLNLPEAPTADAYARATVQTLTGALGRAYVKKQQFEALEAMEEAITSGKIQIDPRDWLPSSVFDVALDNLDQLRKLGARFSIVAIPGRPPTIACQMPGGARWVGQFTIKGNRIDQITVNKGGGSALAAPKSPTSGSGSQAPPRPQRR